MISVVLPGNQFPLRPLYVSTRIPLWGNFYCTEIRMIKSLYFLLWLSMIGDGFCKLYNIHIISDMTVVTCRQIAPPSFSGTPVKKTDSANFSFITLCRSSRGWSEVERARPHSLARNVLTRCSPQPVVLTAVLCELFSTGFWAQHPQPKQLAW